MKTANNLSEEYIESDKTMFQSSWSNRVTLEFIELYKREQVLWDPCNPLHKNRNEISDAWIRIQSSMSTACSINELKKKKESLMTSFRLHLNKKKRSGGSYHTTWFAFPLMESFLGVKYECDSSTIPYRNEYVTNEITFDTETESDHTNYTQKSKKSSTSKSSSSKNKTVLQPKIKRENIYLNENTIIDDKCVDEYDLFGQLLATKLRKLDETQRDIAMHEIDKIMFRAKMQSGDKLSVSGSRKLKSPVFVVSQSDSQSVNIQFEDEDITYQEEEIQDT